MRVVQQLTCLTLGRPKGPAYSTGELLNTPQVKTIMFQLRGRADMSAKAALQTFVLVLHFSSLSAGYRRRYYHRYIIKK